MSHGDVCEIEGCDKKYLSKGLCLMHYARNRKYGEVGPAKRLRAKAGEGKCMGGEGYVMITRGGRWIYEHRWVMEQMIGRRLTREEEVHHKDRDRTNNSPHNLRLFSCHRDHMRAHAEEDVLGLMKNKDQ